MRRQAIRHLQALRRPHLAHPAVAQVALRCHHHHQVVVHHCQVHLVHHQAVHRALARLRQVAQAVQFHHHQVQVHQAQAQAVLSQ